MADVGVMPESDGEEYEDDEDDEDDKREMDNKDGQAKNTESPDGNASKEKTLDEKAFQDNIALRLEALRLNKALGNDDPDDPPSSANYSEEEEYTDSESSYDGYGSDGPAQTDYTAYTRPPKAPQKRIPTKQLGEKDVVAQKIQRESGGGAGSAGGKGGKGGGGGGGVEFGGGFDLIYLASTARFSVVEMAFRAWRQ